jgi:hypothetical protein
MNLDELNNPHCYNHPKRETHLRCNKCERPICSSCAVLTPTGYRCKECIHGQQKVFDTAKWWDYPVGAATSFIISLIGSIFVGSLGLFSILAAVGIGIVIVAAVRFVLRKRRSRNMPITLSISALIGGIVLHLSTMAYAFPILSQTGVSGLSYLLWPVIYAVIVAATIYTRYKGIRL